MPGQKDELGADFFGQLSTAATTISSAVEGLRSYVQQHTDALRAAVAAMQQSDDEAKAAATALTALIDSSGAAATGTSSDTSGTVSNAAQGKNAQW